MANPSGNHQDQSHPSSSFNATNQGGANLVVPERAPVGYGLKHNPGISMEWTAEEHAILEEGLQAYAAESNLTNYAKIAVHLPNKTIRDVALRCRWMTKKENSKRRKEELRKSRDKKGKSFDFGSKERGIDPSTKLAHFATRPNVPPYVPQRIPTNHDDGISYLAVGGPMGEILDQNAKAFKQISTNLSALQFQKNVSLFHQTRDNLYRLMNELNDMPDTMRQMPPLPVKVNERLANTILPPPNIA